MTGSMCALLVVAKAPVAGRSKTRLTPVYSPDAAAELAAASLLDTLAAVRDTPAAAHVVALTGDLDRAHRSVEVMSALAGFTVIAQRGCCFAHRLVNAHVDAAAVARCPVLQIGMDTPQVTSTLLSAVTQTLVRPDVDAVLGPATDGGWWALGVTTPDMAGVLANIETSRPDTGSRTLHGLQRYGCRVAELDELSDVDTPDDVRTVVAELGAGSRFLAAVQEHRPVS
ncbi:DUF2064 domain-containing protein [Rhodococcus sp. D2-41]|uniref:DUF2064 domain-containing protein n=1 Tax=Speluncibacter jeojiensis TaxID=2710754 RepID=A0A9X4LYC4_9ACTN|nr:DUF2064 domain-containing protein [Rhodococcus sp. D2-41]MDG3010882.1 DUF2064 domain-containing protein [Rhodococcus sp. D2-41]MDG3013856.1 DUF2064 domain-containing protein [Corynebacteriales bacterium D3-21]